MSTYSEKLEGSARNMVHVKLQKNTFDQQTGKPVLKTFVQIFSIPEYNNFEKYSKNQGWKVEVLHDPRTAKQKNKGADVKDIDLVNARGEYKSLFNKLPHSQKSAKSIRKEIAAFHEQDEVLKAWQKAMEMNIVPTMSQEEMIEDVRRIRMGRKTVQQESDTATKKIERDIKKEVKAHAETQKPKETEAPEAPENPENETENA